MILSQCGRDPLFKMKKTNRSSIPGNNDCQYLSLLGQVSEYIAVGENPLRRESCFAVWEKSLVLVLGTSTAACYLSQHSKQPLLRSCVGSSLRLEGMVLCEDSVTFYTLYLTCVAIMVTNAPPVLNTRCSIINVSNCHTSWWILPNEVSIFGNVRLVRVVRKILA